jgi:hypothetical protein
MAFFSWATPPRGQAFAESARTAKSHLRALPRPRRYRSCTIKEKGEPNALPASARHEHHLNFTG